MKKDNEQQNSPKPADTPQLGVFEVGISNSISGYDFLHEKTNEAIKGILEFREELIVKKLKEKGIEIDLQLEQRRRFKSLVREFKNNQETIYYNDGSEQGVRIVTFVTSPIKWDDEKMTAGIDTTYY
jgi:hypothetical protein